MAEDVLTYLQSKGLHPKRASGMEVHLPCLFCGEGDGARGRMYVNTDPYASITGLFHCFLCDESGSIVKLKKYFGDYERPVEEHDDYIRLAVLRSAAEYYQGMLGEHPDVVRWLRGPERMLEYETIAPRTEDNPDGAGLGYAPPGSGNALYRYLRGLDFKTADIMATGLVTDDKGTLTDALQGMVTIPYHVAGNCVTLRGRRWPMEEGDKQKYKTLAGQAARVYHSEACWGISEVVITEGELDALVLSQMGFQAIGIPGANVWQPGWDGYLEGMRRVWVAFDPDEAGDRGAEKLIERLGPKARRLRLPCDVTDWVSQGHGAQELTDIMRETGRSPLLVSVDEAIEEHGDLQSAKGVKLDIEPLDRFIDPGLMPGQVMIVLAGTGVGKTIFIENVLQRVASRPNQSGMKLLFVSLEQTRAEWWERARRIWRFYNLGGTDAQCANFWRARLQLVDKNRLSTYELEAVLDDFEYEMGSKPDLVCLDYLGYFARSFKGERYQQVGDAVMELKAVAKERRIPFIAPHQVSRGTTYGEEPDISAARDAGTVEETADILLSMWRPDLQKGKCEDEKDGKVFARVKKSRAGNVGKVQEFVFAPYSLTLVPLNEQRYARALLMAKAEVRWDRDGALRDWEQAVSRHRGVD